MKDSPGKLLQAALLLYRCRPKEAAALARSAADALDGLAVEIAEDEGDAPMTARAVEYARAWTWFTSAELREAAGVKHKAEMGPIRRRLADVGLVETVVRFRGLAFRVWRRPGQPQSEYTGRPVPWSPPV